MPGWSTERIGLEQQQFRVQPPSEDYPDTTLRVAAKKFLTVVPEI